MCWHCSVEWSEWNTCNIVWFVWCWREQMFRKYSTFSFLLKSWLYKMTIKNLYELTLTSNSFHLILVSSRPPDSWIFCHQMVLSSLMIMESSDRSWSPPWRWRTCQPMLSVWWVCSGNTRWVRDDADYAELQLFNWNDLQQAVLVRAGEYCQVSLPKHWQLILTVLFCLHLLTPVSTQYSQKKQQIHLFQVDLKSVSSSSGPSMAGARDLGPRVKIEVSELEKVLKR